MNWIFYVLVLCVAYLGLKLSEILFGWLPADRRKRDAIVKRCGGGK